MVQPEINQETDGPACNLDNKKFGKIEKFREN